MTEIRVGISGWTYAPWRGDFYPQGWPHKRELDYASRRLNSIEINGSFYGLQRPSSYRAWYDQTPPGFMFALKGGRFITHIKRLKNPKIPLANFFASGPLALHEKLGPILWQLPPNFAFDADLLAVFFAALPRDAKEAAALARHHDGHLKARAWLKIDKNRALRHALEVRHDSFLSNDFIALLRHHRIALVVADTAGKWPFMEDITAPFVYVRLHGNKKLYASGYDDGTLKAWAKKLKSWRGGHNPSDTKRVAGRAKPRRSGRDVFVYFDNDVKVHAPFDAMALASQVGARPTGADEGFPDT